MRIIAASFLPLSLTGLDTRSGRHTIEVADIGTCLESPLMAEAVEKVGADKFCATIVPVS